MENSIEILALSGAEAAPFFDRMVEIYSAAFQAPPYSKILGDFLIFSGRLPVHARWKGFKCAIAVEKIGIGPSGAGAPEGKAVGFAYGYTSRPDTWWRRQLVEKMSRETTAEWLADCFEFVELAVIPERQGKGTGGRLHDALLAGLDRRTAVLSTIQGETNALHLYRKRGWVPLLDNFRFEGAPEAYLIMGLRLPVRPGAAAK